MILIAVVKYPLLLVYSDISFGFGSFFYRWMFTSRHLLHLLWKQSISILNTHRASVFGSIGYSSVHVQLY
jgi:hypothetical protein